MLFQVPQFLDIEDKIFGPLTLKQFIYLLGGAGLSFTFYVLLPSFIAYIFIAIIMAFSAALAFYRPEGRPFVVTLESAINYYLKDKLYVWRRERRKAETKKDEGVVSAPQISIPKLSDSKLSDLSWSLDIKEKLEDEMNNN